DEGRARHLRSRPADVTGKPVEVGRLDGILRIARIGARGRAVHTEQQRPEHHGAAAEEPAGTAGETHAATAPSAHRGGTYGLRGTPTASCGRSSLHLQRRAVIEASIPA